MMNEPLLVMNHESLLLTRFIWLDLKGIIVINQPDNCWSEINYMVGGVKHLLSTIPGGRLSTNMFGGNHQLVTK